MFKNVMAYRIGPNWNATVPEIETAFSANRFIECTPGQDKSVGWTEPRGVDNGPLMESVGGQWIAKLLIETKAVPSSVVKRKDRLLAIDAASTGKADEVITQLVRALPGLDLNLLQTATSPQTGMAAWLLATDTDDLPRSLSIEKECILKSGAEDQPMVKYTRHTLSTEEVRKHVREGKLPTQLALSWEGKASFVLTESLQLKKVAFLDGTQADAGNTEGEDKFDADVVLSTGMLGPLLKDVMEALGGENVFAESASKEEGPPF